MSDREQVENQIRRIIETADNAAALSEKLFSPSGLFIALAPSEDDRRVLVRSELFREAQRRFHELRRAEAAVFSKVVGEAEAALPGGPQMTFGQLVKN